jgi:FkbM family methyltransferase
MKFYYGYDDEHYVDVTNLVFSKCFNDNGLIIPSGDHARSNIFGDPFYGKGKHILIIDDLGIKHIYPGSKEIKIEWTSISKQLAINSNPKVWYEEVGKFITNPERKLQELQKHLDISYGTFEDEYFEQLMAIQYINPDAKVLEIGGNIGRNTLIISALLKDTRNYLVLESDPVFADQLTQNIKANGFDTHVEASALSQIPLIQNYWDTTPMIDNIIPNGWKQVSTITYTELMKKYNINFDTIVADCEGALYYILRDEPSILNNVNTVITENDYRDIDHKLFVNNIFKMNGLKRVLYQPGGWGPCKDFFYEVWKKE